MNDSEKAELKASKHVVQLYQDNADKTKDNAAIGETIVRIDSINDQIEENEGVLQTGTKGLTKAKRSVKDVLIDLSLVILGKVFFYAKKKGDKALMEYSDMSKSDFIRLGEVALPAKCKDIKKRIDEIGADLIPAGVTEQDRTNYGELVAAYETGEGKLGEGKSSRSSSRKSTTALLKDLRLEFRVLDKLMLEYKTKDIDFYNQYESAREVTGQGGHGNGGTDTPPEPPAQ